MKIENRKIPLALLQAQKIYAEIREDGVPVFSVCEGKVESENVA
jgi:hypothetical protein